MTTVAVPLVIAAIGALVAVLWTGAHSGTAFGGEIQSGASQSFSVRQFASYVFQFYFGPFSFLTPLGPPYGYRQVFIDTYFGGFASLEVNLRLAIYDYLQIAAAVGLLALMVTVVIRRGDVRRRWPECGVAIVTFVALMSLLHVSAYRDLQVGGDPLLTGRYLLPCVSLYGFTIAWVLGSFRRRIATILASCALGISLVLALQALLVNAARFYA